MTDVYRTPALVCPSCASPMRDFKDRLICDACSGMLIGLDDFRSACADMVGTDIDIELYDLEPSKTEPKPVCPKCQGELAVCKLRVGGKKMRGEFSTCARDGLWFGRDVLPSVFAVINRKIGAGPRFDAAGGHTRRMYQASSGGSASDGLTIARWRNRPRKRAQTLTPVNAYGDKTLRCPQCADRQLLFMADRWGCENCRGTFVQTAALEALVTEMKHIQEIDEPWSMPAVTGAVGARACPVCVAAMTVETLDGVTIDRCPEHGVWFDPTELEVVLVREGDPPKGIIGWLRRLF